MHRRSTSGRLLRPGRTLLAPVLALLALSCDGSPSDSGGGGSLRTPASLRLSAAEVALGDGDTVRLRAAVLDQAGQAYATPPAGVTLSWSSGNGGVASVADGLVTGVRRGQTYVYVQSGSLRDSTRVAVRAAARTLQQVKGSGQTGAAGGLLADTLVVRALDRNGEAVEGVAVEFAVVSGGGSAISAAPATDAQGYARARWTLGPQAGENVLEARAAGFAGSPVRFTAAGGAGVATRLERVSGDGQSAVAGRQLASPFTVRATDAAGNPVSGVAVSWLVTAGGGSVTPAVGTSDAAGLARATLTLGTTAGANRVTAAGAGAGVEFTATGTAAPAPALEFASVHAGTGYTCALTPEGKAYCWGGNLFGQLGTGVTGNSSTPVAVAGGNRYVALSAGYYQTCARTADGGAHCWGAVPWVRSGSDSPVQVPGGQGWKAVAAGTERHACGLSAQSAAFCWGSNSMGELGDGTTAARTTPTAVSTALRFDSISSGYWHTCAVTTDRAAWCWGRGDANHLGDVPATTCPLGSAAYACSPVPVKVGGGHRFVAVVTGTSFSCGLREGDGTAWCWGRGTSGALGSGVTQSALPVQVSGGYSFLQISAGREHACGVMADGTAYCWGENGSGQLGNGTLASAPAPVRVAGGHRFRQVSAGGFHSCGITTGRTTLCWGSADDGQIGDGRTGAYRTQPTEVAGQ
jgi:alpha-tubulin suppressor-like RCC1 family protein